MHDLIATSTQLREKGRSGRTTQAGQAKQEPFRNDDFGWSTTFDCREDPAASCVRFA